MRGRQALHPHERHVPVGMDHHHAADLDGGGAVILGRRQLALEVDGGIARREAQASPAEPHGEERCHVPVGHQEIRPDNEAGPAVGHLPVRQIDAADRVEERLESIPHGAGVQLLPRVRQGIVDAVLDEDDRPALLEDDRLQSLHLLIGQVAVAVAQHLVHGALGGRREPLQTFKAGRRPGHRLPVGLGFDLSEHRLEAIDLLGAVHGESLRG